MHEYTYIVKGDSKSFSNYTNTLFVQINAKKIPVLVGLLSAIQPPFDINFPCSIGYISKLSFEPPGESILLSVLCTSNTATRNIKLAQTPPSGYHFTIWSSVASEIHFMCPEKFT